MSLFLVVAGGAPVSIGVAAILESDIADVRSHSSEHARPGSGHSDASIGFADIIDSMDTNKHSQRRSTIAPKSYE